MFGLSLVYNNLFLLALSILIVVDLLIFLFTNISSSPSLCVKLESILLSIMNLISKIYSRIPSFFPKFAESFNCNEEL